MEHFSINEFQRVTLLGLKVWHFCFFFLLLLTLILECSEFSAKTFDELESRQWLKEERIDNLPKLFVLHIWSIGPLNSRYVFWRYAHLLDAFSNSRLWDGFEIFILTICSSRRTREMQPLKCFRGPSTHRQKLLFYLV